ncbi:MAG: hypothetical protein CMN27_04025 [Salinisphaera sp.]|nr:hypothetical protein [Salinisphaera sp.]
MNHERQIGDGGRDRFAAEMEYATRRAYENGRKAEQPGCPLEKKSPIHSLCTEQLHFSVDISRRYAMGRLSPCCVLALA